MHRADWIFAVIGKETTSFRVVLVDRSSDDRLRKRRKRMFERLVWLMELKRLVERFVRLELTLVQVTTRLERVVARLVWMIVRGN